MREEKCVELKDHVTSALWSLTCNDLPEQLLRGVSKERNAAQQELVQDDAHSPPVHRLPVTLTENNLRGDVLWSSAHLRKKWISSSVIFYAWFHPAKETTLEVPGEPQPGVFMSRWLMR